MNPNIFRNIEKFIYTLLLSAALLPIAGCWDKHETNDLAFVVAAGIDQKQDGKTELSLLIYLPTPTPKSNESSEMGGGSSPQEETTIRSAIGENLADAQEQLQLKTPRIIFLGQCEVFVFSDKAAKAGIHSHMDYLTRNPYSRERASVFVSKGSPKEIFTLLPPIDHNIAKSIRSLALSHHQLNVTLKELSQMLADDFSEATLPYIVRLPPEMDQEKKKTTAVIDGSAIFKKDKMIGTIEVESTKGLLFLRNEMKDTYITVKLDDETENGNISVKLTGSKTKLKPRIRDEKWIVDAKIEVIAEVRQNTTNLNMMDPEIENRLERKVELAIGKYLDNTLEEVQKTMQADVLNLAELFHQKYPKRWKKAKNNWSNIFPTIEVSYDITVKIDRTGLNFEGTSTPNKEMEKP